MTTESRDYSSISPSAGWLMKLKAYTSIPFAKEAAAIIFPETENEQPINYTETEKAAFFKWVIHFENRYRTVEELLEEVSPRNILEISSGYSFRGVDWCLRLPVHFIDTDLPDIINIKTNVTNQLLDDAGHAPAGKLEVMALNAMQPENFAAVVSCFSPGPITIVNEGLLVYLNTEEKKHLCSVIHDILKQRGGYWITGDIYIKSEEGRTRDAFDGITADFRKQHHLDENRFDSFETAERFFTDNGFIIDRKLSLVPEKLSALSLTGHRREDVLNKIKQAPVIRETWRLLVPA